MAEAKAGAVVVRVTVVTSGAARQTCEWQLELPAGATAQDALDACGIDTGDPAYGASIWGRNATLQRRLRDQDRVEWCRGLKVDPKVARRERFASQGSRGAGLFSKRRPGAKSGY
ncbi:RnfH family protein [Diaphorobacter ruginosibacter]|uniref:RnfH family protein n=1 Tax=Diaphorobacter ruginosibacter TaxID=1715720 RepID=UPI00333F31DF